MTNQEALNHILPYQVLLDGKIGLGDFLARMSVWARRYKAKKLEGVTVDKETGQVDKRYQKPVEWNPFVGVADAIEEFLADECQHEEPDAKGMIGRGTGSKTINAGFLHHGEGRYDKRDVLCLIPLADGAPTFSPSIGDNAEGEGRDIHEAAGIFHAG